MNTDRIEAAARYADQALAELAAAFRDDGNAAAAKIIDPNRNYVSGFVRLVLTLGVLEAAFRLPSKGFHGAVQE